MTRKEKISIMALIDSERSRARENLKAAGYSRVEIALMEKGPGVTGYVPNASRPRVRVGGTVVASGFTAFWAQAALDYIRMFEEALATGENRAAMSWAFMVGNAGQRQCFEAYSLQGASKGGKNRVVQRRRIIEAALERAKQIFVRQKIEIRARPTIDGVYSSLPAQDRKKIARSTFAAHLKKAGGMQKLFSE